MPSAQTLPFLATSKAPSPELLGDLKTLLAISKMKMIENARDVLYWVIATSNTPELKRRKFVSGGEGVLGTVGLVHRDQTATDCMGRGHRPNSN